MTSRPAQGLGIGLGFALGLGFLWSTGFPSDTGNGVLDFVIFGSTLLLFVGSVWALPFGIFGAALGGWLRKSTGRAARSTRTYGLARR